MRALRKEYVFHGIWRVLPAASAAVSRACEFGRRLGAAALPFRAAGAAETCRPATRPAGFRAHVCGAAAANDRPLYRDRFDAPDVRRINAGSGIRPLGKYLKFGPFHPAALGRASVALQRTPTVLPITAVSRKIIARIRARKTCARLRIARNLEKQWSIKLACWLFACA